MSVAIVCMINRSELATRKNIIRKNENIINFDEPICKKNNIIIQEISVGICSYLFFTKIKLIVCRMVHLFGLKRSKKYY
jgi:hypothetical protein